MSDSEALVVQLSLSRLHNFVSISTGVCITTHTYLSSFGGFIFLSLFHLTLETWNRAQCNLRLCCYC